MVTANDWASVSLSARRAWIEMGARALSGPRAHSSLSARRAWIEIIIAIMIQTGLGQSLSARRAWIEIAQRRLCRRNSLVALRKESVDRNISEDVSYNIKETSLSARRAWIEIMLKEALQPIRKSRSPQGERG